MTMPTNIVEWAPVATELFTWFWDKFADSLLKDAAKTAWRNFDHRKGAKKYASKVEELYGTMRILGKNEPVSVANIYTSLSILDKFTAQLRYDSSKLNIELWNRTSPQANINKIDGMTAVNIHNFLFIMGRPGAGKSTFLRHVALESINGNVFNTYEDVTKEKQKRRASLSEKINIRTIRFLPVLIELRDYIIEQETTLFQYIAKQFDVCGFPEANLFLEKVLGEGRLIILFDGLDEVPKEQDRMRNVSKEIEDFSKKYSNNKFIITCRIAASEYRFNQFTYVELAEFSNSQAKEFTKKWFQNKTRLKSSFWRDLDDSGNAGLLEMTRNPLLLTLLCLNYEATQSFPSRRVEIYEEALDALLKTWDAERGIVRTGTKLSTYGKLSLGHKKEMFSELAATGFEMQQVIWKGNTLATWLSKYIASIPPQQDYRNIDGIQVLKDIEAQHAILVEQAKGQYSFAHLTFQEYYTANYIVSAGEKAYKKLVRSHLFDSRWREVLLLASSKMSKMHADVFFDTYLKHLRTYINRSISTRDWIRWIEMKNQNIGKSVIDSLMARNFLALCSIQFTREKFQEETTALEYFCKLWGFSTADDYETLLLKSLLGKRLREQSDDLSFDCLLFGVYRHSWKGSEFPENNLNFVAHYNITRNITEKIPDLYPAMYSKHGRALKGIISLARDGRLPLLGLKIEEFLVNRRRWSLKWGLFSDEQQKMMDYLNSSMLCIECLELARVSNRFKIYQRLFS
jgi:hypothetical protein